MATSFINDPKVEGTMTYDHVHPNKKGQLFMMERWYNTILQNLRDVEPPSLEGKPVVVYKPGNAATISWSAANDNYGIKCYEIWVNGKVVATINQNNLAYKLNDLKKGMNYKIVIKAKDWSGNTSNEIATTIKKKKAVTKTSFNNR